MLKFAHTRRRWLSRPPSPPKLWTLVVHSSSSKRAGTNLQVRAHSRDYNPQQQTFLCHPLWGRSPHCWKIARESLILKYYEYFLNRSVEIANKLSEKRKLSVASPKREAYRCTKENLENPLLFFLLCPPNKHENGLFLQRISRLKRQLSTAGLI